MWIYRVDLGVKDKRHYLIGYSLGGHFNVRFRSNNLRDTLSLINHMNGGPAPLPHIAEDANVMEV